LLAGEAGSVPLTLKSSLDLTNLTLQLRAPVTSLTNLNLRGLALEVTSLSLFTQEAGTSQLTLTLNPALAEATVRDLAALEFLTVAEPHSSIAVLEASSLMAHRSDGLLITNGAASDGRVVIVGREPVLESLLTPRRLVVYGRPGAAYALEYRTNTVQTGPWTEWMRFRQVERVATFDDPPTPGVGSFWRAWESRAEAPRLTLLTDPTPSFSLQFEGWPGTAYSIETSAGLGLPWQTWTNFTLTNATEVFPWPNASEPHRFFRGHTR